MDTPFFDAHLPPRGSFATKRWASERRAGIRSDAALHDPVSAHATHQDGRGDQHGKEDGQRWEEEGHEETVAYFSCRNKGAAVAPFRFYCQPFPSQIRTR